MAYTPLSVDAAIGDNVKVVKENLRNLIEEGQDRLGDMPRVYSGYATCEAVALAMPGSGPAPASDGTDPITFAGRGLVDFGVDYVEIDGAIGLNFAQHGGRCLKKASESATTLYLEVSIDRTTGVQRRFSCSIWRQPGSGDVQVVSSSMTNAHLASHTRVEAGGVATIVCDVDRLMWRLAGETEL